jgi:hypothetical protein
MSKPVYIIGSGYSLQNFDFSQLRNKNTITINKSIFNVPNPNYFITIDYTFLQNKIRYQKKDFKKINIPKIFVANYDNTYIKNINGKIVDTRYNMTYELEDYNMIIRSYRANGLGFTFNDFRSGYNSGFCAFQFAVLMEFNPIYLLGFDLKIDKITNQTHYHGGYGENPAKFKKKLDNYYKQFVKGIDILKYRKPDIQVINCSSISRLNGVIPYKTFETIYE